MNTNNLEPTVGMPAHYELGADSYLGMITEVHANGRKVVWTRGQGYQPKVFTRRTDGSYRLRGDTCGRLHLGDASPTNLDPSF